MNNDTRPVVYYIDDSQDALDLADAIVKGDSRFRLIGFTTEQQLYEALKNRTPAGLILDLNLGNNLTGSVLSIKLRKQFPNLPMAIYTNYEKKRVSTLIPENELSTGSTVIWQKSDIGVDELANSIAELINE